MRDLGGCGSGGDRPKPGDLSVARTADPIPLSIQGVKRATAPQAWTPEDAGGRGRGGCGNVDESVGRKQLVVQRLCGFWAAPRNSGGDRVPIELPAGGAELLHCREKRGLLRRSPASILIHGEGYWSEELGQVGVDGCVWLPGLLELSAMRYATVLVRAPRRVVAPDIRHRTLVGEVPEARDHARCALGNLRRRRRNSRASKSHLNGDNECTARPLFLSLDQVPLQSWCLGNVDSDHSCAPVKKRLRGRLNLFWWTGGEVAEGRVIAVGS